MLNNHKRVILSIKTQLKTDIYASQFGLNGLARILKFLAKGLKQGFTKVNLGVLPSFESPKN